MIPMRPTDVLAQLESEHADLEVRPERLAAQWLDPDGREAAIQGFRELLIDIGMHFGFEESLMEERAYADFDHHRRQHLGIMTELGLLLDRLEDGGDVLGVARSIDFIGEWYRQHVGTSDRTLLAWLQSRA